MVCYPLAHIRGKPNLVWPSFSSWLKGQPSPPLRRDCSAWAFIPSSGDDFGLTWLPPSRYSLAFWILIRFCFPPSRSTRPKRALLLQCVSHRRRNGSAFSVRVVKYWNKLPASVVTSLSVNVFMKRLEKVWTGAFPYLPHWLNTPFPICLLPPAIGPAHHPLTFIISICYPTPFSIYVVSLGPLWPTFSHYNS